jgi:hypothetical protein
MENNFGTGYFSQWKIFWPKKNFRFQFIVAVTLLISFMIFVPYFFDFVEARSGKIIHDPLLDLLPVADVSWLIFFFLYFGVISWLVTSVKTPDILIAGMQTYILVTFLRLCSITLFPLEPPAGYVPLTEPFVQFFTNGGKIISKDLFFSGHMTTILFCYFNKKKGWLKTVYLLSASSIGVLLMIQRVHYSIDIIAAPLFTWLCFLFTRKILAVRI